MSEEYDNETEEAVWETLEEIKVAIAIGNYTKANSLLDTLFPNAKEKNKSLEDSMIA